MEQKNFKRTTVTAALPYANGGVHIGHLAGVYVPADIYVRYLRLKKQDVAFIGDDVNDLALLRKVGFSASPSNTPDYVKREVDYVTAQHGGFGAFREFVEKLLSDNGMLETILGKFM